MLNWFVWNAFGIETANFYWTELFQIELFLNLTLCKQNCTYTKLYL